MEQYEKNGLTLLVIGALIGLGKLLASSEELTWRLAIGRTVLGAGTSLIAGVVVLRIPDADPLALIGIACMLGIAGSTFIEAWIKRKISKM